MGENITAQVKIEGEIGSEYKMSLLSAEFKLGNLSSGADCTQIPPFNIPGQMQITCVVRISADNLYILMLINLETVAGAERELMGERKGEKQSEGDEQKSHVLRSITGSYIVCDSLYEDCLKQIDENSEIFVEEGNENVEHEAKSGNDKINIVLIIAVIVLIIIIILVIIYFVRRLRRVKSQSRTSIKGKKDLKTTTITINMTTQQTLKNEGLPNQI